MRQLIVIPFLLLALIGQAQWKFDKNKIISGSLMLVAGGAKGFNETLQFHYDKFKRAFPKANDNWFNPDVSWKNKYRNNDPKQGSKFPLSTTALVFTTDQYHLNNFIQRAAVVSAIVIKLGHKQKFKYYVYDFLYYSACWQTGFSLTYYTF
jgi:hypothetical protein